MPPAADDLDALLAAPPPRPTALVEPHLTRVFPHSRQAFGVVLALLSGAALAFFTSMVLAIPVVFVAGMGRRGPPDDVALGYAVLALWMIGTLAALAFPFWRLARWIRDNRRLARRLLGEGVAHAGRVGDVRVSTGRARSAHARVGLETRGGPHHVTVSAADADVAEGASLCVLVADGEPTAGVVLPTGGVALGRLEADGRTSLDAPGPSR